MSVFEYERDAIRVKARLRSDSGVTSGNEETIRKFSVDPNLTSYETLRNLLARAFDFSLNEADQFRLIYQFTDEQWLPLLSDWDLDAAIISASDPILVIEVLRPVGPALAGDNTGSDTYPVSEPESPAILSLPLTANNCNATGTQGEGGGNQANSPSASGYSFLPSPETIQSIVNHSNKASASFFSKHVNQTIPNLTKKLHRALAPDDPTGGTLVSLSPSAIFPAMAFPQSGPAASSSSPSHRCSPQGPAPPPLSDKQFRSFLDNVGQLVRPKELRLAIYQGGGVEPALRKVVWKHLLGVYPQGINGRQRMDYMKQKSADYQSLKTHWTAMVVQGKIKSGVGDGGEQLKVVTNMVRKDVLRTDRHYKFFAGDGNANVTALFNILTTYALNHPDVGYCQGMSDLLSPLLVTMGEEAHAYVTFCALMRRLKTNFMVDGLSMTKKFQHLNDGLLYYDPEFFAYLKLNGADDLLFCYRWLLLEMKREFSFEESFKVLEVLWSSLPPSYPQGPTGLPLFEKKFDSSGQDKDKVAATATATATQPASANKARNDSSGSDHQRPSSVTAYSKVVSLRRQVSSGDATSPSPRRPIPERLQSKKQMTLAEIGNRRPRVRSMGSTNSLENNENATGMKNSADNLKQEKSNRTGLNLELDNKRKVSTDAVTPNGRKITDLKDFNKLTSPAKSKDEAAAPKTPKAERGDSTEKEKSFEDVNEEDEEVVGYSHFNAVTAAAASSPQHNQNDKKGASLTLVCDRLPEPTVFGDGNPFLVFLCIACLLQHRNHIMTQGYDYQEIAMYFDRMVRRHDVDRTLTFARRLFAEYLNDDWSSPPPDVPAGDSAPKITQSPEANGKANC